MRIVMINSSNFGSTGNMMLDIADMIKKEGYSCVTSCPNGKSMKLKESDDHIYIGTRLDRNLHIKIAKFTGFHDVLSIMSTLCFVRKINRIKPDILHIHNLHDCYINIPILFHYIKKKNIPVIWTLHDCWAFTAKCPHFTIVKCKKWETGCNNCIQVKSYPKSYIDMTKALWKLKKKWFTNCNKLIITTPSQWLEKLVKKSYLKEYPIRTIYNGIDLETFRPTKSNFKEQNMLLDKYIVLGVSFNWGYSKGLDIFCRLANELDATYRIVLIGTDDKIDKLLPDNIMSIHRTYSKTELRDIYSAADVFVNPTREEVLGMVNIEAIACGTPVVTFDTGGSPECIDESCGAVVECDDFNAMKNEIIRICEDKPFCENDCVNYAKKFNRHNRIKEYIELYDKMSKL